jgi:hypothetical protein
VGTGAPRLYILGVCLCPAACVSWRMQPMSKSIYRIGNSQRCHMNMKWMAITMDWHCRCNGPRELARDSI